jgi:hypothetical protein
MPDDPAAVPEALTACYQVFASQNARLGVELGMLAHLLLMDEQGQPLVDQQQQRC